MKFNSDYNKLPEIYVRSGKECYFDPIRKKLIYVTPEETVRQKCIQFLLENDFPKNIITVEEHLSHYGIESKLRADIIVRAYSEEENIHFPVAVIECKSPNVPIDTKACEQVFNYADLLGADYVAVTNGYESRYFHYDEEKGYQQITELPVYNELLEDKYTLMDYGEIPDRIAFDKLRSDGIYAYSGYDVGENTSPEIQVAMVNLLECLLDQKYKLPLGRYGMFELVKDLGIRIMSYGDASGSVSSGLYRSFLINYNGSTEIVSICVSTYCTWAKQDIQKTSINVAIDNNKESHHSLQLVVDDNIYIDGKTVKFYHSGKIAVGNIGSGKIDELRFFTEKYYPEIIAGKRFYFGQLENDHLWNISDSDVTALIKNLISYALVRDEYRKYLKAKNKKMKRC